jgi:TetR/AcrR family transcriptional regulator, regulator of autoinduction and epiphytic fitness
MDCVSSTSSTTSGPKRSYRSPTRERRARETREQILAAASAEFLRSGYAATTIRVVATAAGVSVATVELVFGTKPQLLRAAISLAIRGDADPIPMLERDWARKAQTTPSAPAFLAIVARVLTGSAQRAAGLVVAAIEAARVDESMQPLADQLRAQRAETATWIVDGLIARASLRPETSRDKAIDTVWLLMDPHAFCALTHDRGWTPQQYERWFTDSLSRLLLVQTEPAVGITQGRCTTAQRSTITDKPKRATA